MFAAVGATPSMLPSATDVPDLPSVQASLVPSPHSTENRPTEKKKIAFDSSPFLMMSWSSFCGMMWVFAYDEPRLSMYVELPPEDSPRNFSQTERTPAP